MTGIGLRMGAAFSVAMWATAATAGQTVTVTIADMAFSPAEITISAGDTIQWRNDDFLDHTATESSGAWEVDLKTGASAERAFPDPGEVKYYCRFHPNMTGTIRVQPR